MASASAASMRGVALRGLRTRAVGPIDLVVAPGECVGLSGASGTGKTLLLRAIADLDVHDGDVLLDGVEARVVGAPEWRRRVGMLPAESGWWHDTVGEHFVAGIVPEAVAALGLAADVADWPVSRLSAGERQRLALLRLLANRPRALLLDEPTAHLDGDSVALVEDHIGEYRRRTEASVLWVAHDALQLGRVAERQVRLAGGRLAESR